MDSNDTLAPKMLSLLYIADRYRTSYCYFLFSKDLYISRLRTPKQDRHICNILLTSLEPLSAHSSEFHSLTSFTLLTHPTLLNSFVCVSSFVHSHTQHSNLKRTHSQNQNKHQFFQFLELFDFFSVG